MERMDNEPTAEQWLAAAEQVLTEIHDNSRGEIPDPHFRHWAAVSVMSYFSAKSAPTATDAKGSSDA